MSDTLRSDFYERICTSNKDILDIRKSPPDIDPLERLPYQLTNPFAGVGIADIAAKNDKSAGCTISDEENHRIYLLVLVLKQLA